jgi:hypothetical protein
LLNMLTYSPMHFHANAIFHSLLSLNNFTLFKYIKFTLCFHWLKGILANSNILLLWMILQ